MTTIPGFEPPTPEQDRVVKATASGFTIEFDINELLHALDPHAHYSGYNPETGEDYFEAGSLADLIVTVTAEKLAKAVQRQVLDEVTKATRDVVLAQVEEHVRTAMVGGTLQPTDEWGRKQGEPKPLVDVILGIAGDALTKPLGDSYSPNRPTLIQKLVEEQVTKAFKAELQAEVVKAREAALAAVKASAAEVISETIQRASRGL